MDNPADWALIKQAREWPRDGFGEGMWFNAMADRIEELKACLDRHHARMGCINYCSVCGKEFDWKALDPETAKFAAPSQSDAAEKHG